MKKILAIHFLLVFLISCQPDRQLEKLSESEKKLPETVFLTKQEKDEAGIQTCKIKHQEILKTIECKGKLLPLPASIATVTAPLNGFVRYAYYGKGEYIAQGTILAVLEHPDYIKIQEEFLKAKNKLAYQKNEFARQGELTVDNATSIKKYQKAQADYRVTEVKYLSLKAQLKFLGIDPDKLTVDGLQTTINVFSPISGYVTKAKVNPGKYVDSQEFIFELVNGKTLQLQLRVDENEIHYVKPGQKAAFSLVNNSKKYDAEVNSIEKMVNESSRTVNVNAMVENAEDRFITGMSVNGLIQAGKVKAYVLPRTAIVYKENKVFVYLDKKNGFEKEPVKTGAEDHSGVEIINPEDNILKGNVVLDVGAFIKLLNVEKTENE